MIAGILFFQAVACAVLSGVVAHRKNRDLAGWVILGFLFGLFGLVAALVVGEAEPQGRKVSGRRGSRPSGAQEFDPDEHEKKCPMCAEYIKLEARRCKHCKYEFPAGEVEQQIEEAKKEVEPAAGGDGKFYCQRTERAVDPGSDGYTCPACGSGVQDGSHPLAKEMKPAQTGSEEAGKERRICPTCETPSPLGRKECPRCGSSLLD